MSPLAGRLGGEPLAGDSRGNECRALFGDERDRLGIFGTAGGAARAVPDLAQLLSAEGQSLLPWLAEGLMRLQSVIGFASFKRLPPKARP